MPNGARRALRRAAVALALTLAATTASAGTPSAPRFVYNYPAASGERLLNWIPPLDDGGSNITSYKVQWRSGTEEEYRATRQTIVSASDGYLGSTHYMPYIRGLVNQRRYTFRVIATNADGDGAPSAEVSGTPLSVAQQGQLIKDRIRDTIVPRYEGSYPWVRDIWEEMRLSNTEVSVFREGPGYSLGSGSQATAGCSRVNAATGLPQCTPSRVTFGQRGSADSDYIVLHELAHLHTLGNDNADYPGPLGIGFVYLHRLPGTNPALFDGNRCYPSELYADLIAMVTMNTPNGSNSYWNRCFGAGPSATRTEALGVVRSALRGEMPSWLANTYGTAGGGLDRERLWTHVKTLPARYVHREPVVMLLRNAFGGYCNTRKAASSAFRDGPTRDPWRDGGCVPEAPGAYRAVPGDGSISVSWEPPAGDGGSPIEGYKVRWRSGSEDYDAARESVASDPDARAHTVTGLEPGIYTVRVVAYNTNGDGAPTTEATATARDRLTARFPETAHSDGSHTGPGDRPAIVVDFNRPVQSFSANTPSVETTGGTVQSVAAHGEAGLANAYRFTLRPAGDAPVVFRLRTGQPCASGGICSALGSTLSEAPAARTLPGPGPVIRSAEVNGAALVLTFDEALDESAIPGRGRLRGVGRGRRGHGRLDPRAQGHVDPAPGEGGQRRRDHGELRPAAAGIEAAAARPRGQPCAGLRGAVRDEPHAVVVQREAVRSGRLRRRFP